MTLAYTAKLGFSQRTTNFDVQKIDSLAMKTYGMITIGVLVIDKLGQIRFFKETFLLADISMEVVLEILFLLLSHVNVNFEVVTGKLT